MDECKGRGRKFNRADCVLRSSSLSKPTATTPTQESIIRARYLPSLKETLLQGDAVLLECGASLNTSGQREFPETVFASSAHSMGARLRSLVNARQRGASQYHFEFAILLQPFQIPIWLRAFRPPDFLAERLSRERSQKRTAPRHPIQGSACY